MASGSYHPGPPNKPFHLFSPLPGLLLSSELRLSPFNCQSTAAVAAEAGRSIFHPRQQNQLVYLTVGRRDSAKNFPNFFFLPTPSDHKNNLIHWPVSAQVRQRGNAAGNLCRWDSFVPRLFTSDPVHPRLFPDERRFLMWFILTDFSLHLPT